MAFPLTYTEHRPPSDLAPWVACFWQIVGGIGDGAPVLHRVLPDGCADLLFDLEGTAGDGRLAFVILAAEGIEIMYQTTASIKADLLKSASVKEAFVAGPQQATLFVEVSQLAEVEGKLRGERLIMPRRTTFYGSTELGYADPAGNIVVFAENQAAPTGA